MYYYIFESAKNSSQKGLQEKIKDYLGFLGIAGETVTVSPARSVEELTQMGLDKKYSTIVAVGGDVLINKVASLIQGTETVLGIIPIDASELISKKIGAYEYKSACENLRYRRTKLLDLAFIEPNKYFLTSANIVTNKATPCTIEIDDCRISTNFTQIAISSNLTLMIMDETQDDSLFTKTLNWLAGRETPQSNISILKGKKIKIHTTESLPVLINDEVVAKTPISVRTKFRALKIIVERDKIEKTKN